MPDGKKSKNKQADSAANGSRKKQAPDPSNREYDEFQPHNAKKEALGPNTKR